MLFQPNEIVGYLHEKGEGRVISFDPKKGYLIQDEFGFERYCQAKDLIKIYGRDYVVDEELLEQQTKVKNGSTHQSKQKKVKKHVSDWEIDLHIENLIESERFLSNAQILHIQLKAFQSFLRKAKMKKVKKIIVIHGVGEGVLKEEIRSYLTKQDDTRFYDGDYSKYGYGATAIELI